MCAHFGDPDLAKYFSNFSVPGNPLDGCLIFQISGFLLYSDSLEPVVLHFPQALQLVRYLWFTEPTLKHRPRDAEHCFPLWADSSKLTY